jgi:hypothetical protein
MCCWCSCLECIHNIPPLNLIFLHFSDWAIPGEAVEAAGPASISVPSPVPSATEDAENIRKAVQGISGFMLYFIRDASPIKNRGAQHMKKKKKKKTIIPVM